MLIIIKQGIKPSDFQGKVFLLAVHTNVPSVETANVEYFIRGRNLTQSKSIDVEVES
jgi:hypothetical protein